jgi:ATP phosphoribosyltransferase
MKFLRMKLKNINMSNLIKIGIPSKGRLRNDVLNIFKKMKLKLSSEKGKRDLVGYISGKKNIKIIYLHAREIIESLGDGSLDFGFSGYDLLRESEQNIQNKIKIVKKYEFGKANLVIAIPDDWIDVQTIADLEEIAFEFKDKKKKKLRVSTKYLNLTRDFLYSRGVTQFKLIKSLGSTEVAPLTGTSEIVSDITSTGETLKANKLRILKDGQILKSQACLMISKLSSRKSGIKNIINLLGK